MKYIIQPKLITNTILLSVLTSYAAVAEMSANIGVTSNYLWRSVTQSNDSASVSGGIDYTHESGFYAGTWVGSLGEENGAETDVYVGFSGDNGNITYDFGYIYYLYTELDDSDFGEAYFNATYSNFGLGIAYTTNSQVTEPAAFDSGDIYLSVSYAGIDLGNDFELSLTAGSYRFDADGEAGELDYSHAQVDMAKGDFTFSISKAQNQGIADGDLKVVASWVATF